MEDITLDALDEEDEDDDDEDFEDDIDQEKRRGRGAIPVGPSDILFDQIMEEYDDENLGYIEVFRSVGLSFSLYLLFTLIYVQGDDEEDIQGTIDIDGDNAIFNSAIEEYLQVCALCVCALVEERSFAWDDLVQFSIY